jgi:hypothetical protein
MIALAFSSVRVVPIRSDTEILPKGKYSKPIYLLFSLKTSSTLLTIVPSTYENNSGDSKYHLEKG